MAAWARTHATSAAPRSAGGPRNPALRGLSAEPAALSRGARGVRSRARSCADQFRPDREEGDGLPGAGGPGWGAHSARNGPAGSRACGARGNPGELLRPDVGAGRDRASVAAAAVAERV